MVGAVYPHRYRPYDATEQAAWCDSDGVTQIRRAILLPMLDHGRDLGCNILKQTAAAGDIHGLHASADAEQREICPSGQADDVQLKTHAAFAHGAEGIALAFTIERRWKVRPASGEEESVELLQEASSGAPVCMERKDQRNAAEFFDSTNIACAQKVGGLASTPFLPITGVEVWCDADDGLHRLADGLWSMGWRIVRVSDSQEADGPIAL